MFICMNSHREVVNSDHKLVQPDCITTFKRMGERTIVGKLTFEEATRVYLAYVLAGLQKAYKRQSAELPRLTYECIVDKGSVIFSVVHGLHLQHRATIKK
ncbi:hypothetical protein P5673_010238, partial [Acropora cervicornis]